MAQEVRHRRGSEAAHTTFTGGEAEITVIIEGSLDEDRITAVVHDGVATGGYQLARRDLENVDPPTGRSNLLLGTAAVEDVGDVVGQVPLNTQPLPLAGGAYEPVGVTDGNLVLLVDSVPNPGTGAFPAISAENLINFPAVPDRQTQANTALSTYTVLDQNNIGAQLLFDGVVDAFVDSNFATITGGQYNSGAKLFEDTASAAFTLESATFSASTDPAAAHVVVLFSNTITPNTDFVVAVSRDGGTTFTDATVGDRGVVLDPAGNIHLLTGSVDISGQPAGTDMRWRITTTGIDVEVHGVGLFWQTNPFVGV